MQGMLCQHTNMTCGSWERQRQTLRRGWRAACQINKLHNNIISSVTAKTASRQAPSGPVSADSAVGQQKCIHTVTHAWACTRVDPHERTHGWSSQVNVTEMGLQRQLRLCASMCTKTSWAVYLGTEVYGFCSSISCGMIITVKRDIWTEMYRASRSNKAQWEFRGGRQKQREAGRREGEDSRFWKRQERTCKEGCKLVFSMWVQRKRMHKSSSLSWKEQGKIEYFITKCRFGLN